MSRLSEKIKALEALNYREKYWAMEGYKPYPKQMEYCNLLATERLLDAGNQLGKTLTASMETAFHLTGIYPDWWQGRRWSRAVRGAACGLSSTVVRDIQQKYLCGMPGVDELFGTGSIPKDLFVGKPTQINGIRDAYDTLQVRHVSGGVSTLRFMSYEQGREKFQGATLDFIWNDEELPKAIYFEQLARISATNGIVYVTFTPMGAAKEVYDIFLYKGHAQRRMVKMTIDDAPHMNTEAIEKLKLFYPKYQWATRLYGEPMAGVGAVFPIDEDILKEPAITTIPEHWFKIWGIDFGIGHPFGYAMLLWDKETDIIHVHAAGRLVDDGVGSLPIHHAKVMKAVGAAVPVAWPQDGSAREKSSGKTLASIYKSEGLLMLNEHATHPDGSIDTEAGVMETYDRMASGRWKVASHLSQWFEEFRGYHRDEEGRIVKEKDDILSASRVALMMKRFAKQVQLGGKARMDRNPTSTYTPVGSGDLAA